jgi:cytochrome P450
VNEFAMKSSDHPVNVPADRIVDFDIFQPPSDIPDIHYAWKKLQDSTDHSIVWTPHNGGHWIALRGALIEKVLSDHERFTSYTVLIPKATVGEAYRFYPLSLDPPDHQAYRAVINHGLMPKAVNRIESHIRELTVELIEGFRERGQCDFTHEFAEVLPLRIFMDMVKLPLEDLPKLKYLADQYTRPDGKMELPDVTIAFHDYLRPFIHARRGKGLDDLLSKIVDGRIGERTLTDEEASNLAVQVLVGGLDTVVNFMGFVMLHLARSPASRHTLIAHPERIPKAVLEFLRRFPIVADAREVRQDQDFEGVRLLEGEMVLAPTVLHGLDERMYDDPMEVRLDRSLANLTSFGKGVHLCPGQHLARLEMKVLLEEWLKRIPDFALEPGTVITYAGGINQTVTPYRLVWDVEKRQAA